MSDGHIAETLNLAARCDMAIIAIGNSGPDCPMLHMANCSPQTVADLQATVGRARALGAVRVVKKANQNTPPPRAAQMRARAAAGAALPQGA